MTKMLQFTKLLFLLLIGTLVSVSVSYAADPAPAGGTCSKECGGSNFCTVGVTSASVGKGNQAFAVNSSSNSFSSKCLKDEASKGCFDTVPTSCAGSYTGLGYRPNGAGGNSKPRNHYGSDIGAAACKKGGKYVPIAVYAAAKGDIVYKKTSGGGGRTIQMQHKKDCSGARDPYFKSTYRHLLSYTPQSNPVEKGVQIGVMGGSNSKCIGCDPCDNPEQSGWAGYQHNTNICSAIKASYGVAYYAIHMHFEIEHGAASSSSTAAHSATAINPGCPDLQRLCGGCSNNSNKCGGAKAAQGGFNDGTEVSMAIGEPDPSTSADSADSVASSSDVDAAQCANKGYLDPKDCVFCDMFKAIFNTASVIAKDANVALAGPSKTLVGIGFLIWLAIYLLKNVASMAGTSTGEMLKGIVYQGFRVAVITIILSNAIYAAMDLTLNPVMETGLNFVQLLNENSSCAPDANYLEGIQGYDPEKGYDSGNISGGLSINVGRALICGVKNLEDSTSLMMGYGKYSICISLAKKYIGVIPHLTYFLSGALLWLAGLLLLLCFPWCLIDCMLQLCVAAALVPCGLAAFAFKITSKYLKIVWNFFMNAMFNFVFMAIIVYIINENLKVWLGLDGDGLPPPLSFTTGYVSEEYKKTLPALAYWGMMPIKIAAVCFLCWTFFDEAKSMAEKFADSPSLGGKKGIGRMVGGTMANFAQNAVAKPALAAGASAAKTVGGAIGSGLNSAVGNKWRSGVNHFKGRAGVVGAKLMKPFGGQSTKIKDANGNTIGYQSSMNILGMRFERKVTKDADGIWTQEKNVHRSNAAERAFEKKFDQNGNVEKIAVKDINGNIVKDANGNDMMVDAYVSKHRTAGITHKREAMEAVMMDDGKIVYHTANDKRQFTMGADGNIESYKVPLSSLTGGLISTTGKVHQHGGTRTVNDGMTKTRSVYDSNGNIIKQKVSFKNESAKYLQNKDGTINTHAMMQMREGAADKDIADKAIVSQIMANRGQGLPAEFAEQKITRNDDGSITINQTCKDLGYGDNNGQKITVTAKMQGDIMMLDTQIVDKEGNITHIVSNGIQSKTETFKVLSDKNGKATGQYEYQCQQGFTDYAHAQNKYKPPLDRNGNWGNSIDRNKAMAGFTDADFNLHINELNNKAAHDQRLRDKPLSAAEMQNKLNSNLVEMGVLQRSGPTTPAPTPTPEAQNNENTASKQAPAQETPVVRQQQSATRPDTNFIPDEHITHTNNSTTDRKYHDNNRVAIEQTTDHRGNKNTTFFDRDGNKTQIVQETIDSNGNSHVSTFDGNGVKQSENVRIVGSGGQVTEQYTTFDAYGNVTANGNIEFFQNGDIASEKIIGKDGSETSRTFFEGQKIRSESIINQDGSSLQYTYDIYGNVVSEQSSKLDGHASVKREFYQGGKLYTENVTEQNGDQRYQTLYEDGKTRSEGIIEKGGSSVEYTYDKEGHKVSEASNNLDGYESVNREFDANGNMSFERTHDNEGYDSVRTFHKNGNIRTESLTNDKGEEISYAYDEQGNQVEMPHQNEETGNLTDDLEGMLSPEANPDSPSSSIEELIRPSAPSSDETRENLQKLHQQQEEENRRQRKSEQEAGQNTYSTDTDSGGQQ
ncbi:MAG: hypothetical protein J6N49_07185 [Alphaproteobacteria bacterium]|nr:hypothetical protein [Alphaproteobacteria bacterium]